MVKKTLSDEMFDILSAELNASHFEIVMEFGSTKRAIVVSDVFKSPSILKRQDMVVKVLEKNAPEIYSNFIWSFMALNSNEYQDWRNNQKDADQSKIENQKIAAREM
ncbi:MAG: hypothetical protein ACK5P5_11075 [Pseudobdellovibrionaceae bacterium]